LTPPQKTLIETIRAGSVRLSGIQMGIEGRRF
jgi:hypothetical protein